MPPVIQGSYTGSSISERNKEFANGDLGYKYPMGLDFRPGHKLHDDIVSKLMQMASDSYEVIQKRYPTWNSLDEIMTAYISASDYEKQVKQKDKRKPISIVVPFSYAAMETILAYMTKAFLTTEIFSYEGVGPEDTVPAALLSLVVNQQVHRYKSALDIHTGFRDGLLYGFHASNVAWAEKWGMRPVLQQIPRVSSMGTLLGIDTKRVSEPALLFEGNKINAIDPYKSLPDPNTSIHKAKDGDYFGWFDSYSMNNLLSEEATGNLFNVKYLDASMARGLSTSKFDLTRSKRDKDGTGKGQSSSTVVKYPVVVYMYVNLVPRDWNLPADKRNPNGDYPEKWLFAVGNDAILLMASPLGLNHNDFPIALNSPDFDGYSIAPVSRLEMNYGLQEVLNWTFNSHIENVRKAINDMFVVDPSLISMTDLQNPEAGKLLRLRRSAWGRGVDQAIKQLEVSDVTRNNIGDASFIIDMMQKVGATPDAGLGVMRQGSERRSAAEFSGTFGAHISRLEHLARITSLQYMQDLGYLHASHTQQLMSQDVYVRSVGEWPEVLAQEYGRDGSMPNRLPVSPFEIIADFDTIVKDGSAAPAGADTLQFWSNIFPAIVGNPALFTVFDVTRIMKSIARLSGEKNVNDFIRKGGAAQAQVLGNDAVLQAAQKGDIVPVGGA